MTILFKNIRSRCARCSKYEQLRAAWEPPASNWFATQKDHHCRFHGVTEGAAVGMGMLLMALAIQEQQRDKKPRYYGVRIEVASR